MRNQAIQMGVPPEATLIEKESLHTPRKCGVRPQHRTRAPDEAGDPHHHPVSPTENLSHVRQSVPITCDRRSFPDTKEGASILEKAVHVRYSCGWTAI